MATMTATIMVLGSPHLASAANCEKNPNHHTCGGDSGSSSPNEIVGTEGDDDLCALATPGDDIVKGLGGNDMLCGLNGSDNLQGGDGSDVLYGGDGDDTHASGDGDDTVFAGAGDDRILGDSGSDIIHGEDGRDWISYNTDQIQIVVDLSTSPGTVTDVRSSHVDTVTGIEKITGTANNDVFIGSNDPLVEEFFGGGRGDDIFNAGDGDDFIGADRGDDRIRGGAGNDTLRGAENRDVFIFFVSDFPASENDVVEDFNAQSDSLEMNDLCVAGIDTTQNLGGKGKTDSVVSVGPLVDGSPIGSITFWDVSLSMDRFSPCN
jgi:Ca2+-binding RTX toxin-like protein